MARAPPATGSCDTGQQSAGAGGVESKGRLPAAPRCSRPDKIFATSRYNCCSIKKTLEHCMFHATFVVKHAKKIVDTSIPNSCNIETSKKINSATSQRYIHLQHPKRIWNIPKSLLQHHEIPIATWQRAPARRATDGPPSELAPPGYGHVVNWPRLFSSSASNHITNGCRRGSPAPPSHGRAKAGVAHPHHGRSGAGVVAGASRRPHPGRAQTDGGAPS
jgi:hypothetical protein